MLNTYLLESLTLEFIDMTNCINSDCIEFPLWYITNQYELYDSAEDIDELAYLGLVTIDDNADVYITPQGLMYVDDFYQGAIDNTFNH